VDSTKAQPGGKTLSDCRVYIRAITPPKGQGGVAEPKAPPLKAAKGKRGFGERELLVALDVIERCEKGVTRDIANYSRQRIKRERAFSAKEIDGAHGQNQTWLDWLNGEGINNMGRGVFANLAQA